MAGATFFFASINTTQKKQKSGYGLVLNFLWHENVKKKCSFVGLIHFRNCSNTKIIGPPRIFFDGVQHSLF